MASSEGSFLGAKVSLGVPNVLASSNLVTTAELPCSYAVPVALIPSYNGPYRSAGRICVATEVPEGEDVWGLDGMPISSFMNDMTIYTLCI